MFCVCFNDGSKQVLQQNLYQSLAIVPTVLDCRFGRPATLWLRLVRELRQALLDGFGNRLLNGAKGALGASRGRSVSPLPFAVFNYRTTLGPCLWPVLACWSRLNRKRVVGGLSRKPILALRGKPLQATRCHCVRIHRREDGGVDVSSTDVCFNGNSKSSFFSRGGLFVSSGKTDRLTS
jgi:hypothetical protein